MAILPERYYSNILPFRFRALLGYKKTIVSDSFLTPQKTLMSLELLREVTQARPDSNSNLGPCTQHMLLYITQDC